MSGLNDDFFFGARLAVNDKQSTDFLGGMILDSDNGTIRYFSKANRRIGAFLEGKDRYIWVW